MYIHIYDTEEKVEGSFEIKQQQQKKNKNKKKKNIKTLHVSF